jgi:hypothetical protein
MVKQRRSLGFWLSFGMSVVAAASFALIARAHSWFYSDDYIALALTRIVSFTEFVKTPIDVHFLPLHRLATWLIYTYFPLNFDVALAVMVSFYVASVWMLYRTLEVIGKSSLNGPLTALCGTSFYAAVLLLWWTVGIARFPYVFFCIAAIYQYLEFRRDGSLLRVAALLVCLVCATAFFTKALLIPGFLVAIELALFPGTPRRNVARNVGVILVAILVAIAYYKIGVSYGVDEVRAPTIKWDKQLDALVVVLVKSPLSLLGIQPSYPHGLVDRVVIALWASFIMVSVWRDRFNAMVWSLCLGVVIANFLVITFSQRMVFGAIIVTNDRYYFENLPLIALFIAIIVKRMRVEEWLTSSSRGGVVIAGAWLAVGLLALGSQARFLDVFSSPRYAKFPIAREFGLNLTEGIADLRQTHRGKLGFANGYVPMDVLAIAAVEIRDYSEVLPIFDRNIAVIKGGSCLYSIQDDGTIRKPPEVCP